jgi:GNAT superfamily N-acetyltransferase
MRDFEQAVEPARAERKKMTSILPAASEAELDDVRLLMRAFVAWHRASHAEDRALIDRYFDAAEFERELAGLPGKYAPPKGRLLIAYHEGRAAGCVALRDLGGDLGESICEMKRMFVPEFFRGQGIGRALADRVIDEARLAGYRRMRLDTSFRQRDAIRLYERSGFRSVAPYYPLTDDLKDWLVFFERVL